METNNFGRSVNIFLNDLDESLYQNFSANPPSQGNMLSSPLGTSEEKVKIYFNCFTLTMKSENKNALQYQQGFELTHWRAINTFVWAVEGEGGGGRLGETNM
jgi:hypothetical protein